MNLETRSIVSTLRLEDAHQAEAGEGWELWQYGLRDPASQRVLPVELSLLVIKSRGVSWHGLHLVESKIRHLIKGNSLSVVVQRSSPLAADLDRVKKRLRASAVHLVSDLLEKECQAQLGSPLGEQIQFQYFVEPLIEGRSAIDMLIDWLVARPGEHGTTTAQAAQGRTDPVALASVAVLLAPAGVGKTQVAREVARVLPNKHPHLLPLLLEPPQWESFSSKERPTLWTLVKTALEACGRNVIPRETFEVFARAGCVAPILDGLDEVGSIRGGQLTPLEMIRQLRTLAEESDCRILVTSRDALWAELIPEEIRGHIREFCLQTFGKPQIAKYRERRFPNPRDPARERFDNTLSEVIAEVHPNTTANVPPGERVQATPLVLEIIAIEAEVSAADPIDVSLQREDFKDPLYAITYGMLDREHRRRNLRLTPSQQFMMISTLVVDMGEHGYPWEEIQTAAEFALGSPLTHEDSTALRAHPLLRREANDRYVFRFDYLPKFAPAVWLSDYLVQERSDRVAEKYLASLAGTSSPVTGFVRDLLVRADWKRHLGRQVAHFKEMNSEPGVLAFLWELAQSLLPGPGVASVGQRMDAMYELFGDRDRKEMTLLSQPFFGPIVHMDLRGVSFVNCLFRNVEWIGCHADAQTRLDGCRFEGRFVEVQSHGLKSAVLERISDDSVDAVARADLERLFDRPQSVRTSPDAVKQTLTTLLQQFHTAGYFVARTREDLRQLFAGPAPVRNFAIERLLENRVLEEDDKGNLKVVKAQSGAVTALLDNGNLNRAVRKVADEVLEKFAR